MLKAKRLKSMFVLYSACAVMATGFTSQAASEQPEVTTITETKGENTNTHTAVQAISQNIVASAQEMTDVSQQVIADNIAKKEEEERLAKEKAEQEAQRKAAAESVMAAGRQENVQADPAGPVKAEEPKMETVEEPVNVIDFRVYATREQLMKLKGFLKENGIRFEPVPKQ